MSEYTFFSISLDKGLRANVAKEPMVRTNRSGQRYVDVMLFLVPNSTTQTDQPASQVVNAHFPENWFEKISQMIAVGDYVRLHFKRLDFSKPTVVNSEWNHIVSYMTIKEIYSIEVLRKANDKTKPEATTTITTDEPQSVPNAAAETIDSTEIEKYRAVTTGH